MARFSMKDLIKVMKALSEPNRVKIVKMLQHKTMCVCEMQEALKLAQPTVSKHLRILEDAGLVDFTKDGLWVNYFLANGGRSPYVSGILDKFKNWLENDPNVAEIIKKLPTIRREDILK
jgi:ArsR family transcriptional regulator